MEEKLVPVTVLFLFFDVELRRKGTVAMRVTCFGHRELINTSSIRDILNTVFQKLIQEGAAKFFLGGYGEFDRIAASVLNTLKQNYPYITVILVIPYPNQKCDLTLYDSSVYPPLENVPARYAILRRNEWMVDQSDIVVSYIRHPFGGAFNTTAYAKRRKKRIILL